ncbi:MAG: 50S ribosomal protein L9 [Bacteroidales bacterium]|jgi:large subunit ribosomal protein L9|nr:50S ribosomal protein L9 [Bacteroidales bacterium]MCK9499825.1 50S ribosomal protein L9 [Bacteroidales bacterium]MDY0314809.1 50S ribosomal protein L9 [Bacteroidales bacterium]NLB87296.1 50S ribosomal protein L9 [Bacteroidales bacterium]
MEIILKQDVENLGHKDEIVNVKPGYARNYLIPQGFAIMATSSAKKVHTENMKQKAHKEAKLRENAEAIAEKMNGLSLRIGTKTSSTGKIFGSINTIMISEALEKEGFSIDRKNIIIKGGAIKEVGNYEANVKIYKNIKVIVPFEVFSEE